MLDDDRAVPTTASPTRVPDDTIRRAQRGDLIALHDLLDAITPYVRRLCGPTDLPAPDDPALAADIRDVLDRLSPEHRAVLTLRDLEDIDEHDVGKMLGVPTGTVQSRLFRARQNFRRAWRPEGNPR